MISREVQNDVQQTYNQTKDNYEKLSYHTLPKTWGVFSINFIWLFKQPDIENRYLQKIEQKKHTLEESEKCCCNKNTGYFVYHFLLKNIWYRNIIPCNDNHNLQYTISVPVFHRAPIAWTARLCSLILTWRASIKNVHKRSKLRNVCQNDLVSTKYDFPRLPVLWDGRFPCHHIYNSSVTNLLSLLPEIIYWRREPVPCHVLIWKNHHHHA